MGDYTKFAQLVQSGQLSTQPVQPGLSTFQKVIDPLLYPNYLTAGIYLGDVPKAFRERITPGQLVGEALPPGTSPWVRKPLELATDVLTDLTTYVTFGAAPIAKAGAKAGAKAVTAKFAGKQFAKSEKVYQALAEAGKLAQKIPLVKETTNLFKPYAKVKRYFDEIEPGLGDKMVREIRIEAGKYQGVIKNAQDQADVFRKTITSAAKKYGVPDVEAKKIIYELTEYKPFYEVETFATERSTTPTVHKIKQEPPKFDEKYKAFIYSPEINDPISGVVAGMKKGFADFLMSERAANYVVAELDDDLIDYMTRVWIKQGKDKATASHLARKYRNIGSTVAINEQMKKAGIKQGLFIIDPAFVFGVRANRNARLLHTRKMIDNLTLAARKAGADVVDAGAAKKLFDAGETLYITRKDWVNTVGKGFDPIRLAQVAKTAMISVKKAPEGVSKFYRMGDDMATHMNDLFSKTVNPVETKRFSEAYDSIHGSWKAWTLAFPSTRFRDFVSNKWNNFIGGVYDPKVYAKSYNIIGKLSKGTPLTIDESQLVNLAKEYGIFGAGQIAVEGVGGKGVVNKILGTQNPYVKFMRGVGTSIDDADRFTHFVDKIQKGMSPEDAMLSANKFMLNYRELTDFERNVMKRIFPFYTWSRKNIPLQIENIIKQPGKYAAVAKVKGAIESGETGKPNEKFMADWMSRNSPIYFGTDKETGNATYFLLGAWLPAADLMKMGDPLTEIASMVSPLFKVPAELAIPGGGYNFFFDDKIERVPGEPGEFLRTIMKKKTIHVLKSIRLLNEIDRLLTPKTTHKLDTPAEIKIVRATTGLKLYPYNEQRARIFWERDIRGRIQQLRSLIRKGQRLSYPPEEIQKYLMQIQKEKIKLAG